MRACPAAASAALRVLRARAAARRHTGAAAQPGIKREAAVRAPPGPLARAVGAGVGVRVAVRLHIVLRTRAGLLEAAPAGAADARARTTAGHAVRVARRVACFQALACVAA